MKIFIFLSLLAATFASENKGKVGGPEWNTIYSVKGILYIPYAEIEEPFYVWYDSENNQSRIDYYGGMVKTYQLTKEGSYGSSLKIAPITTESVQNEITCLQVNGTDDEPITIQSILPDLSKFECEGEEQINGLLTEKWRLTETMGNKVNKYAMWLHYGTDPKDPSIKVAIPVKYEMRGFNSLLGSHYDHYYLEYDSYDVEDIPDDVFKISKNLTCRAFPGPGDKHIYTFNPMKEFVYPTYNRHVDFEFKKFMNKHKVQYGHEKEHEMRKSIFAQNLRFINSHNRKNKGFTVGVNHLADKTPLELKALRGKTYSGEYNGGAPFPYTDLETADVPDTFDWRIYGAVTPVKDQSVCGSCWSFGTVGAVEGAYFLKNGGKLVRLSQQALVDCSWGYGNNGCDGGEDFRAYQWMLKHGGIPTEDSYGPYLGQDGFCHADKAEKVAPIKGWVNVTTGDEKALRFAIFKHGPVSVAIDASHKTFSFYSNGVYYDESCGNKEENLDHAVLAVGYGSINGSDYWLIKNSWSTYWGNDGYILMSAKNNNCGVMTTPTYVVM